MNQPQSCSFYNGYRFFKADPLPQQSATWDRAERTKMRCTQIVLFNMVDDRASEISAASQYRALSDELRAQVNQLVHDRGQDDPYGEWSCAYAEENSRGVNSRDSMTVILMRRPLTHKAYPRTPMGDLVELRRCSIPNGQTHDGRVATMPSIPAGHTLPHNYTIPSYYRAPSLLSMQKSASMASRMMNQSALPEG